MYSSQRIFNFTAGNYVVSDEFRYVVDIDEVAPFGKSPFFAYDKIVNDFVVADGWPLIINFPINKDSIPFDIPVALPGSRPHGVHMDRQRLLLPADEGQPDLRRDRSAKKAASRRRAERGAADLHHQPAAHGSGR